MNGINMNGINMNGVNNMDTMQQPPIMNSGPISGTSISSLMSQQDNINQIPQHNNQIQIPQLNQLQYLANQNKTIQSLVTDINASIDQIPSPKPQISKEPEIETETETETEEIKSLKPPVSKQSESSILLFIKELIIFMLLYYVFSIGQIKKTLGGYIRFINPNSDGDVSFIGIILYGLILGTLFIFIRNLIIR